MVALAQPNFVNMMQQALGGQNPANNAAASALGPMLGGLAGNAPAPVPQQAEMPQINFAALSKVSDPDMQKMVLQWLMGLMMQREEMRARQQGGFDIGSMPFRYTQLPQEKWGEAAEIEAGIKPRQGSAVRHSPRPAWAEGMTEEEWAEAAKALQKKALEGEKSLYESLGVSLPEGEEFEAAPKPAAKTTAANNVPPAGLGAIWPKLDDASKESARKALARGAKPADIIKRFTERQRK